MITQIGIIAGDIWHYLDNNKQGTVEDMVSAIGKSKDLVLMGLGWLAREGHVTLAKKGTTYKVTLTK